MTGILSIKQAKIMILCLFLVNRSDNDRNFIYKPGKANDNIKFLALLLYYRLRIMIMTQTQPFGMTTQTGQTGTCTDAPGLCKRAMARIHVCH